MTLEPYLMDTPNEDVNDYEVGLHQVRYPNGLLIVDDPHWQPSDTEYDEAGEVTQPSDLIRPTIWDGWLVTCYIRDSREISDCLDELYEIQWDRFKRKRLHAQLLKFFDANYERIVNEERTAARQRFHDMWPTYAGITPAYELLTQPEVMRARRAFESAVTIIGQWCMSDFSHRRYLWPANPNLPAAIVSQVPASGMDMSVILRDKLSQKLAKQAEKPVKKNAKELRAEKLAAMTPEQRAEFLKAERLRELVLAAKRSGKVDEQDLIDLDVTL